MEVELAIVRLHDQTGDDLGICELPAGWTLDPGDLLADEEDRLVIGRRVVVMPPRSAVAALVEVSAE